MKLLVLRTNQVGKAVLGTLFLNEKPVCNTLELADIIPLGWYRLQLTYSPKFQRLLPLLSYVPGHTAIRMHAGNTLADTKGCILVGTALGKEPRLFNAREAERKVVRLLTNRQPHEECFIEMATPRYRAAECQCLRLSA